MRDLEKEKDLLEEIIDNRQRKQEDASDFIEKWWKVVKELESK